MAETQEEMSSVEKNVARQIEYYFGDHNLPRDKFLKEQLQLDDGWVTLETMLKFNRLKCLTTDPDVIVSALQKSNAGLLEVSDDKTKVRRSPDKPTPERNDEYKDAVQHKSVYVKGFPMETTLDEIQEWLNGKGPVEMIHMRKTLQRQFKGSVFVCFDTEESSTRFVERSDVKSFKDNEMMVLSKGDYHAKKAEERKQRKAEKRSKATQDKEEKQQNIEEKEMGLLLDAQTAGLLKFSGELEQASREDFHELFSGHGTIRWVDFVRGAKEGTLLFDGNAKEAFDKAKEANGGTLQVKDSEIEWQVLEGDEQKEALRKIIEAQQEMHNRQKKGKGGRGRGSGQGRGRGRGSGRGRGGQKGRAGRDQDITSQYQGKKTTFESDEEEAALPSPKKRALEGNHDFPVAKVVKKTENGSYPNTRGQKSRTESALLSTD